MDITVLGPQRRTTATRTAVAELIPTGRVATINAGWRERESADTELGEVLGGRMVNLRLYQRWQELVVADPEYAAAEHGLTELLDEQQAVYAQRVFHAVAALDEVNRRDKMSAVRAAAVADGIRALRTLDRLAPGRGGGVAPGSSTRRRGSASGRAWAGIDGSWRTWSTTAPGW